MMSVRAFLALLGAFILIGMLITMSSLIQLDGAYDGSGKPVVCGDVYSSNLSTAPNADQDNEFGRIFNRNTPSTDYVAECRSARTLRQVWTIPLAVVGGALLLGGLLVRPRRHDQLSPNPRKSADQ